MIWVCLLLAGLWFPNLLGQGATAKPMSAEELAAIQNPETPYAMIAESADAAEVAANNAWMLTCSALVLFMTAPGLAMFYGGLVRKKNILSVLMQCVFLMGMMTVIWAIYGYSLAFSTGTPFFGSIDHLFMNGVGREWSEVLKKPVTPMLNR